MRSAHCLTLSRRSSHGSPLLLLLRPLWFGRSDCSHTTTRGGMKHMRGTEARHSLAEGIHSKRFLQLSRSTVKYLSSWVSSLVLVLDMCVVMWLFSVRLNLKFKPPDHQHVTLKKCSGEGRGLFAVNIMTHVMPDLWSRGWK